MLNCNFIIFKYYIYMGDLLFLFVFFNTLVVSTLLWLITFIGSFLYETKQDLNREVHFECGFFSINKIIPSYNLNFVVSAIFLILYDVEFLIMIPALFNLQLMQQTQIYFVLFFITSVVFSLYLDIESQVLKWYFD